MVEQSQNAKPGVKGKESVETMLFPAEPVIFGLNKTVFVHRTHKLKNNRYRKHKR